ncbi:flagellar basal body P-ring protein FlgI [Desulfurobacterium atlanticum]|uniref:Flagellar P-ring protein n=1 Tax=Desulfurobacterium atlanticum TaxID=240169 RepID=A0A238ZYX7_9BACT|nr:flagellar basal body P-ring protein FlgI [Desulfurobacterium atlanticum]SNR88646.1 flagellar P-ring protein precursor FlgI [Desulfurobacterium atlanticum]
MVKRFFCFFVLLFFIFVSNAEAVLTKIGTEVNIEGVRPNFLTGYGIVVGLDGTGDGSSSVFTLQSVSNMLRKMGIYVDPKKVKTKNAAAVIVTAKLPPFAKPGMTFDVNVASIGDAKDLSNGILIRTPLLGPDGKIYAFAQGPVSTGGGYSESNKGGKVKKNFPTTGIIPSGGIVERGLPFSLANENEIVLTLKHPSFTLASTIADAINSQFGKGVAYAVDSSTVKVLFPAGVDKVSFISQILNLPIETKPEPVVVIYERTGTVIMSGDIKIDPPVYVAHGNIYVSVMKKPEVSQPPPLSGGNTTVTENVTITVKEEKGRIFGVQSANLRDLVKALNDLGVSPRDLIAIIQAIKAAGKLHAKIVVM